MIAEGIGPSEVPVYTTDGMQSRAFAATVDPTDPSKVSGIKGTAPAPAPASIESPFHEALAATGTEPVFSAHYYDCTILTALAAVKAETDDPTKLRLAFNANLEGSEDCNTFASVQGIARRPGRAFTGGARRPTSTGSARRSPTRVCTRSGRTTRPGTS